jgi:hypothetical protein
MKFFDRLNWIFYTSWDGYSFITDGKTILNPLINLLPNSFFYDSANWTKVDSDQGKLFFDYASDFRKIIQSIEDSKNCEGFTFILINRIDPDFFPKLDLLFKRDVYGKVKWVLTVNTRTSSLKDSPITSEIDFIKLLPMLCREVGIKSGKKFFYTEQGRESYLWSEGQENIYTRDLLAHVRDYKISLLE